MSETYCQTVQKKSVYGVWKADKYGENGNIWKIWMKGYAYYLSHSCNFSITSEIMSK